MKQSLSLRTAEEFAPGSLVSVKLALFPGPCRIETLARVVRCEGQDTGSNLALEFTHLRDVDREALIRHVCHLERQRLQARARR